MNVQILPFLSFFNSVEGSNICCLFDTLTDREKETARHERGIGLNYTLI